MKNLLTEKTGYQGYYIIMTRILFFPHYISTIIANLQNSIILYYDNDLLKNYVIVIYNDRIASFDFNINQLYKIYYSPKKDYFYSLVIYKSEKTKLIISSDNNILVWDFHSGDFEKEIFVCHHRKLRSVCPWNDKYYFTGSTTIRLVDVNNEKIKKISKKVGLISSIKKYIHPQFGEYLITKSNSKIQLWRIEK